MSILIGKVARLLGISSQTIRNYEQEGLLKSSLADNNYRQFSGPDITLLLWIKKYKDLGFSLKEIKTILTLSPKERLSIIREKIQEIDAQEKTLVLRKECLLHKAENCENVIDSTGKIIIEERSARNIFLYSENRLFFDHLFDNNDFATLIDSVIPLEYVTLLPKDDFASHRNHYFVGFAVKDEHLSLLPQQNSFTRIPAQICVSVILNHSIQRNSENTWAKADVIETLEKVGIYDFLKSKNMTAVGDVIGAKKLDILSNKSFDHYLKYYIPIFQAGVQPK